MKIYIFIAWIISQNGWIIAQKMNSLSLHVGMLNVLIAYKYILGSLRMFPDSI